ncbi:MAG: TrmH family RNA methyltransferase [Henriciella sp.]
MVVVRIEDAGDQRLAAFTSIRERDLHNRGDGRFIVEGLIALKTLLTRSRFPVESLLVLDSKLPAVAALMAGLSDDVPVYAVSQPVIDRVAGYPVHRGVLACARKSTSLQIDDLLGMSRLLVLNQISNHDNVGAAFRNAAAFGIEGVVLDQGSCDPLYRKAIRVSAGASLYLPYVKAGTGSQHLEYLTAHGFDIWAMTPRRSATALGDLPVPKRLALVLGAEGPGLPADMIARATAVRIPMVDDFDSLNVATAAAIAMAHIF